MKVMFVENREKTRFWEKIATLFAEQEVEVSWLVQNHAFEPANRSKYEHVLTIPYPSKQMLRSAVDGSGEFPELASDRGRRFFHAGSNHYCYYRKRTFEALRAIMPDLVIGESTLFHELITIDACRRLGIKYVQPSSNRYPAGRFMVFQYDTQMPAIESGDTWSAEKLRESAEKIASSKQVPFYMKNLGSAQGIGGNAGRLRAQSRLWLARLGGERFNTPSLTSKLILGNQVRQNLKEWSRMETMPTNPSHTILYPLQMQPEANIDVWGHPYSDQVMLIRELLAAAPDQFQVSIKLNPKTKYELSEELMQYAKSEPRLCLLPSRIQMPEALRLSLGAVTVTGTVGLEAICGKGRVISLKHPVIEKHFPNFHAESPKSAVERLINDEQSGCGNVAEGVRLLGLLVNQSFPGKIGDPSTHAACMTEANVAIVASSLMRLFEASKEEK